MQVLHDGAGIYCFAGQGLKLQGNFIHDIEDTGSYGASSYYLDERSENCVVEGNLSVNVARPSHNHMALKNTIRNNVFIYDGDMWLTFPKSSQFTLEKNVIYATGIITITNPDGIAVLENNILYSGKGKIIGRKLNNYSDSGDEVLAAGEGNVLADPVLLKYAEGKVEFGTDSPAGKLGIRPIDVSFRRHTI